MCPTLLRAFLETEEDIVEPPPALEAGGALERAVCQAVVAEEIVDMIPFLFKEMGEEEKDRESGRPTIRGIALGCWTKSTYVNRRKLGRPRRVVQ